jgi:hypothetical protein
MRPSFAESFPRTPELDALVDAFADGDYARVRREAPALAAKSEDEAVKAAALELVARTKADPLAVWLLVLTGALLVFMSAWWIAKGHAPEKTSPSPPPVSVERVR